MQQSAQDNIHPYMKANFWFLPQNQFWNRPSEVVFDRKTGAIDRVLETSERGKEYFMNMISELDKKSAKKTHLL